MLKEKTFAVPSGTTADKLVLGRFPNARIIYFNNVLDCALAVKDGKADAAAYDKPILKNIAAKMDGLTVLDELIVDDSYGFAVKMDQTPLKKVMDEVLKEIKSDGTYDNMSKRWFPTVGAPEPMPQIKLDGKNGVLRFGTAAVTEPMSFVDGNQQVVGYDIEYATYIARKMGKKLVVVNMDFSAMIPALISGKVDMIGAGLSITEERAKSVLFSESYYPSGIAAIVRSNGSKNGMQKDSVQAIAGKHASAGGDKPKSFGQSVSDSFYNNILYENRYKLILDGLNVTLIITLFAALLGTLLGGLICFLRMSKNNLLSGLAKCYITLLRGLPVLVLLMIIFYVIFASVNINPIYVAILAFALNFAAYVSEMFRTSIESVDKGQYEAGIASGFTKVQTFSNIILPQALLRLLPVYKGEFISMLKMTSIVGYIAVQDVTRASDIIRSRTFDAFFPLFMAAFIYLALAWLLTWLLDRIERSVDPKRKKIKKLEESTL